MHHFRTSTPAQLALPFPATSLRRINPAQNAARFYSMDVERDLFGRVVLVRKLAQEERDCPIGLH
jgi:hypothetical protein